MRSAAARTAATALALTGLLAGGRAQARQSALLASPGAYSLAPVQPEPGSLLPASPAIGGVASVGFGSRNTTGSSVELDGGVPGVTGTRAFAAVGEAQGNLPGRSGRDSQFTSRSGAIGVEKQLTDGLSIGVAGGWQRDRLP